MNRERRDLFGIRIDAVDMRRAVAQVMRWVDESKFSCRTVVTPNVDHTVLLRDNQSLQNAYAQADLVLADGHPIVWAAKLLGRPVPERVPGSDLVPQLFEYASPQTPLKIFLLGAAPGVAQRAAANIKERWPAVQTVGIYSPPIGFEKDSEECNYILGRIALSRPDLLVVGLGAPKQECWVANHRTEIQASAALCVGATIDFLAGEKNRAPYWMQRTGTEWLYRMCTDPKRLVRRYAKDAWIFPQLVMQQWVAMRRET